MKAGVLKQGFTVNTVMNVKIKIPKNTIVTADDDTVFFKDYPLKIHWLETERAFFVEIGEQLIRLQGFKPQNPYPLSMIRKY